jgi:hypothetical protein
MVKMVAELSWLLLLPIPSICDSNGSKDHRHLSEKNNQTKDREFGPVEHNDPDQNGDRGVATRKLDRESLELAPVGAQRRTDNQTGTRGNDRKYNR